MCTDSPLCSDTLCSVTRDDFLGSHLLLHFSSPCPTRQPWGDPGVGFAESWLRLLQIPHVSVDFNLHLHLKDSRLIKCLMMPSISEVSNGLGISQNIIIPCIILYNAHNHTHQYIILHAVLLQNQ